MKKLVGRHVLWTVIVLVIAFGWAPRADAKGSLTLHVAPDGRDTWSGRIARPSADGKDGPLASIIGARDAIRKLRKNAPPAQPITVEIADGTYRTHKTIIFTPEDSGSKDCPVTYRGATGRKPVISGGRVITGWKKTGSKGIWKTDIPDVKKGRWFFRQLFINGKRAIPAREPNEKDLWYQFVRTLNPDKAGARGHRGDVKAWRKGDEVEVVLFRTWDTSRFRVTSFDPVSALMHFRVPKGKILSWWAADRRYFLENSLSFLNSPGEWFLDRKAGVLYLRPFEKRDVSRAEIIAPVVDRLVRFEGTAKKAIRQLHFRGLTFRHARWDIPKDGYDGHYGDLAIGASIEGDFVKSFSFEECRFDSLGLYAIGLGAGCTGNKITKCEFTNLGAGAIKVGEPKRHDLGQDGRIKHKTSHHEITYNHIYDCGRVWKGSLGIWVGPAHENLIARNHLHDLPYTGISVGWVFNTKPDKGQNNIIEFNYVHDIMLSMSDGGGIYTMGLQPGTVIRNNIIHDSPGWEPMRWANGIYTDLSSSEILIENNLVFRMGRWVLCMGTNKRNILRNNIFAVTGGDIAIVIGGKDNLFERNIIVTENNMFKHSSPSSAVNGDRNLYYRIGGKPFEFKRGVTFKEWQAKGKDMTSVEANPGFVDMKNGNFTLKANSPALKLGFKPFKLPVIGPPRMDYTSRVSAAMRHKDSRQMTNWPIPRIQASAPSSKIVIDGRLTEKAWKDIKPTPLSETKIGKGHDPRLNYARVACDGKNLYVAMVTNVPEMKRLHADGNTWNKHDWGIVCFQGAAQEKTLTPVYTVWGWASGAMQVLEVKEEDLTAEKKDCPKLARACRFAAKVGKNKWTGEWKIPLTAVGIDPFKLEQVRFNMGVRRSNARDGKRKWGMWLDTGHYVWDLRHAGLLVVKK